jgi:hypothetical protein
MTFDFRLRTSKLLGRLGLLGVWYKPKSFCYDSLFFVHAFLINIFYNVHVFTQVAYIFVNYDDMEKWSSSALLTLTELLTNMKAYYIIINKATILKIQGSVKRESFQPKNPRQEEMAKSTFKIFDTMYLVHMMGPTVTIMFFGLYPLLELKTKQEKHLPFSACYPYDYTLWPYFELTYIYQIICSFVCAFIHVQADCLAFNLIAILVVQVDYLTDNLRNMGNKGKNEKRGKCEHETDIDLYDCIAHHKEILS